MQPPQELLTYIRTCRSHGMADKKIRENLIGKGWQKQLVLNAFYDASPKTSARKVAPFSDVVHRPSTFREHPLKHAAAALGAHTTPDESKKIIENFIVKDMKLGDPPLGPTDDSDKSFAAVVGNTIDAGKKPKKRLTALQGYGIVGVLVLITFGVGGYFVFPREAPQATAEPVPIVTTIRDQNYSFVLPKGWQKSSDYNNGAGVNVFYQTGSTNVRKGSMTVFVTPAGTQTAEHVSKQIDSLRQNGGTATITETLPVMLGQTEATITEVAATTPSNPNDPTEYVYLDSTYGDTLYDIDVMIPSSQWASQKDNVMTSLKTFRPANAAITHRQK